MGKQTTRFFSFDLEFGPNRDDLLPVFAIKALGHHGGGLAIVAAVDEGAAKKLATGIDPVWRTTYHAPESIVRLPVEYHGLPAGLTHFEIGE